MEQLEQLLQEQLLRFGSRVLKKNEKGHLSLFFFLTCVMITYGELEKVLHQKKPTLETAQHFQAVVNSYLGLLSHYSSFNIRHELLSDLSSSWRTYFEVDENYKKINLKTLIM